MDVVSLHKETLNLNLSKNQRDEAYREFEKRKKQLTPSEIQQINKNIAKYKKDNHSMKKQSTKTRDTPTKSIIPSKSTVTPTKSIIPSKPKSKIKKAFKKLFRI